MTNTGRLSPEDPIDVDKLIIEERILEALSIF
jgi:hypothetical protein